MPKVSVVVAVYNTELYVKRAISSLMEQTLDDVEFIIIDDGSTDNSLNIIKQVIGNYPRHKDKIILVSRENCGIAATRKQGMALASGDYVIHLDSDDWADRNWLDCLYTRAISDNADMVVCDYAAVHMGEKTDIHMPAKKTGIECLQQLFIDKQRGYTWNKLVSRRVINKIEDLFVDGVNYLEDYIYIAKCFCFSEKICYIDRCLYFYNQDNVGSITKGMSDSKRRDIFNAIDFIDSYFNAIGLHGNLNSGVMIFKIRQKMMLIYGEWDNVSVKTWRVFPETNPYILRASIPLHFKICMLFARYNLYGVASILMRWIVKLKIYIFRRS